MKILTGMISNFKRYWFLMTQLISRDFKVKYKRSVLGIVWSLLNPILMMTVMAIVFSQMFKFKVEGINYLVYLMTGLIMFNYFSAASNAAMTSVVENFTLINKVYIPKYIFPIAKCLFVGIDFVLTLIPWLAIIGLSYFGLGEYTCHFNIYFLILPYIFICMFLIVTLSNFLIDKLLGWEEINSSKLIFPNINSMFLYTLFVLLIYAPFIEGIIFTKIIKNIIKNKIAWILISGILFGLLQIGFDFSSYSSLIFSLPYIIIGILVSFIYEKKENVFYPIFIWFFYYLFQFFVQYMAL